VRNEPREHERVAAIGSRSRGSLLTLTGRFAAGAGRRLRDRRARRTTSAQPVSIRVIREIRGWSSSVGQLAQPQSCWACA